jgi:hypothetical protein
VYVSVTGLKPKHFFGRVRFWMLAVPAFRAAQKAAGCLFCEAKKRDGYHHTLTVWVDKQSMMAYRSSPVHRKTMKVFAQIAQGKVCGYEANSIPTWQEALLTFDTEARVV